MTVQIKAGKFYCTSDGRKLGPAVYDRNCAMYPWDLLDETGHRVGYTKDGRWIHTGEGSVNDLVSEWADPLAVDPVNQPPHYTGHPSGVECIQITEHMNFCRGNAIKYIWRAGEKGSEIEDLKKAAWYIEREISRLEEKTA